MVAPFVQPKSAKKLIYVPCQAFTSMYCMNRSAGKPLCCSLRSRSLFHYHRLGLFSRLDKFSVHTFALGIGHHISTLVIWYLAEWTCHLIFGIGHIDWLINPNFYVLFASWTFASYDIKTLRFIIFCFCYSPFTSSCWISLFNPQPHGWPHCWQLILYPLIKFASFCAILAIGICTCIYTCNLCA